MWIFLNDSFLSIVQEPGDDDRLLVRARLAGDIEAVFPGAEVVEDAGTDYRFRARIPRNLVAEALMQKAMSISYSNFKSSVPDRERHDAYMHVWDAMYQLQERKRK